MSRPPTKTDVFRAIAEKTGLTRAQVGSVFDALEGVAKDSLKKHGAFTIPDFAKVVVVHKKATPAREGRNPFTGETMMFKAKPARKAVKVRPVKNLKTLAGAA